MIKRFTGIAIVVFGLFLLAGAVGLTLWNFKTDINAGITNEEILDRMVEAIQASTVRDDDDKDGEEDTGSEFEPGFYTPEDTLQEQTGIAMTYTPEGLQPTTVEPKNVVIDGREFIGILSMPTLGLELSVQSECSDKLVDISPGRWAGSPYKNGFVIGGHNYIRHLGRIDRLKEGDSVLFTDLQGQVFKYTVVGQQILDSTQGKELCDDEWGLSLFTCTLAGNRRIVVRCMADASR